MNNILLKDGTVAQGYFLPEGAKFIDSPRPTEGHEWENDGWVFKGFSEEQTMRTLRQQRNYKLGLSDWWANSDLTMTAAQKKYRQDLRDITSTSTPVLDKDGLLTGVTWPAKPE